MPLDSRQLWVQCLDIRHQNWDQQKKKDWQGCGFLWEYSDACNTFLFYFLVYFAGYTSGFIRALGLQGLSVILPGYSSVASSCCYFDLWGWGWERERGGRDMSFTKTCLFYIWKKRELFFGGKYYLRVGITVTGLCQTYRFLFKDSATSFSDLNCMCDSQTNLKQASHARMKVCCSQLYGQYTYQKDTDRLNRTVAMCLWSLHDFLDVYSLCYI